MTFEEQERVSCTCKAGITHKLQSAAQIMSKMRLYL